MEKAKGLKPMPAGTPADLSVESFIQKAIETQVPIDTLERLLTLRERVKSEKAKEEFDAAMAEFQGECPTIAKTKSVPTGTGKTAYSYAPLESIVEQVKSLLQKHGFSYSTQTETKDGGVVKSTCIVKHKLGHSESSSMEVPLGNKTNIMSQSQVVAAALTFAKRYAFCNAFGIMTGDEDNEEAIREKDGNKGVNPKHEQEIRGAKNLQELKEVWANLPETAKGILEPVKNEVKVKLEKLSSKDLEIPIVEDDPKN